MTEANHTSLADQLVSALSATENLPFRGQLGVHDLRRIPLGASQELWEFTLRHAEGESDLVLRRPPADAVAAGAVNPLGIPHETEMLLQSHLSDNGVSTPRVHTWLSSTDGKVQGFVMDRLTGTADPKTLLTDESFARCRASLIGELAREIAKVHTTELPDSLRVRTLDAASLLGLLRQAAELFRLRNPGFEWAFRWLSERVPPSESPRLVHGDFRLSNIMADEQGLTGIIDWELAHLGDPMEDLGWLCLRSWRFSRPDLPAAGLAHRGDLLGAYEEASGTRVVPEHVQFWEALGALKWAGICLIQYGSFFAAKGKTHGGIDKAAIGRRFDEAMGDFFAVVDDWKV